MAAAPRVTLRPHVYAANKEKIKGWMQNHQVSQSSRRKSQTNQSKRTHLKKYLFVLAQEQKRRKRRKRKNLQEAPSDLDRFLSRIGTSALLSAYLRR